MSNKDRQNAQTQIHDQNKQQPSLIRQVKEKVVEKVLQAVDNSTKK